MQSSQKFAGDNVSTLWLRRHRSYNICLFPTYVIMPNWSFKVKWYKRTYGDTPENLVHSRLAFMVTQGYRNRHKLIRYLTSYLWSIVKLFI